MESPNIINPHNFGVFLTLSKTLSSIKVRWLWRGLLRSFGTSIRGPFDGSCRRRGTIAFFRVLVLLVIVSISGSMIFLEIGSLIVLVTLSSIGLIFGMGLPYVIGYRLLLADLFWSGSFNSCLLLVVPILFCVLWLFSSSL